MKFEDKIKRIEEISDLLENEEIELNEMIKLYEEGIKLTNEAKQYLENTELKIKKISGSSIEDFNE
jgi:exodeoxyribonuclease VII small subunit